MPSSFLGFRTSFRRRRRRRDGDSRGALPTEARERRTERDAAAEPLPQFGPVRIGPEQPADLVDA